MFEATTNAKARNAMQRAHKERGEAVNAAWNWLLRPFSR